MVNSSDSRTKSLKTSQDPRGSSFMNKNGQRVTRERQRVNRNTQGIPAEEGNGSISVAPVAVNTDGNRTGGNTQQHTTQARRATAEFRAMVESHHSSARRRPYRNESTDEENTLLPAHTDYTHNSDSDMTSGDYQLHDRVITIREEELKLRRLQQARGRFCILLVVVFVIAAGYMIYKGQAEGLNQMSWMSTPSSSDNAALEGGQAPVGNTTVIIESQAQRVPSASKGRARQLTRTVYDRNTVETKPGDRGFAEVDAEGNQKMSGYVQRSKSSRAQMLEKKWGVPVPAPDTTL